MIKIPRRIKRGKYIFKYVEKANNKMYLYEEEKLGYKECFLISDLIQLPDMKEGGERK